MRAAARTFPVRAAASSSTSSFAPPPTSLSERAASELGAGADFVMALTLTLHWHWHWHSLHPPLRPPATPAFRRTCFSRNISAIAREIKPVPVVSVGSRPPASHPTEGTKASNRGHEDRHSQTWAYVTRPQEQLSSHPRQHKTGSRARFRRAGPRESGIRRAPSPTPPCRSP